MSDKMIEKKIVAFVDEYCNQHDYPPSYREISAKIGTISPTTVCRYMRKLDSAGRICIDRHKPRSARLRCSVLMQRGTTQRVQLETSDGGVVRFDCSVEKEGNDELKLLFEGIYDVSEMKSDVGNIVRCQIEQA